VQQDQPAPAAGASRDYRPGHQHRPGDMDRGHGGQLVSTRRGANRVVNRLPVSRWQVHDAERGQHPRRCDWDEGNDQADRRAGGHRVAHRRVAVAVPGEQPDQHGDEHSEVHGRVVEVRDLRQQRMREDQALDLELAEQADRPLDVPDPPRVIHRARESAGGQVARQLPQRVERDHQAGLAQEGAGPSRPASGAAGPSPAADPPGGMAGVHEQHTRPAQPDSQQRRLLPVEHEVRHGRANSAGKET
jgi:hypothetical protein